MVVAPPFGGAGVPVPVVVEVAVVVDAPTTVAEASGEFEFSTLLDVEFLTDSRLPLLLGECFNAEKYNL